MEDQQGYARWSPAEWAPEDSAAWPTIQYTTREDLGKSLSFTVALSRATGRSSHKAEAPREVVITKPEGEPVGLTVRVDEQQRLVVTGTEPGTTAEHALQHFTQCIVALVNGVVPEGHDHFVHLSAEGTETRLQFLTSAESEETLAAQDEYFATLRWQQKVHHPEELLRILDRDDSDTQKQELVQYLRDYSLPEGEGSPTHAQGPNPLAAPAVPAHLTGQLYASSAQQGGGTAPIAGLLGALASAGLQPPGLLAALAALPPDAALTPEQWDQLCAAPEAGPGGGAGGGGGGGMDVPNLDAKLEHLLHSTLLCTYVAGEPHHWRSQWLASVTTADAPGGRTVADYENILGIEQHVAGSGPVVKYEAVAVTDPSPLGDIEIDNASSAPLDMWVVAAFGHPEKNRRGRWVWVRERDVVLSHIVAVSSTSFTMTPPLSGLGPVVAQRRRTDDLPEERISAKPYTIRVPFGRRGENAQYRYSISIGQEDEVEGEPGAGRAEHASDCASEATTARAEEKGDDERRQEMLHRVIVAHYRQMQTAKRESAAPNAGAHFLSAPVHSEAQVHFFGDIMSASSFECSNLFIRSELCLPRRAWRVDASHSPPGGALSGDDALVFFTQTSRMTRRKRLDGSFTTFFAFAMPFELHCAVTLGSAHPRMLLELHSERQFGSQQLEGYGFVDLAVAPGSHRVVVQCWRPVQSVRQSLREFFLNVSTELEDASYAGVPASHEGPFLNKFGFHSESTGQVEVRWNCIVQAA